MRNFSSQAVSPPSAFQALYQTYYAWHGRGHAVEVPLSDGRFVVQLHFAVVDPAISNPGELVFDVYAEGTRVIRDLDVLATVGFAAVLIKTVTVDVLDGALSLTFAGAAGAPQLNALEISAATADSSGSSPVLSGATPLFGRRSRRPLDAMCLSLSFFAAWQCRSPSWAAPSPRRSFLPFGARGSSSVCSGRHRRALRAIPSLTLTPTRQSPLCRRTP
jgi:hypothetical protein